MSQRIIWGHVVGVDDRSRNVWPDDLKPEVVDRIVRGERISRIAGELGTSAALVQKWWGKLKPEDSPPPAQPMSFAEVQLAEEVRGLEAVDVQVASIRFTINGLTLEAERAVPLQDLTTLLEAMGRVR